MKTSITSILTAGAALLLGSLAAPVRADILYVANSSNNTIEKFTSGGVGSVFANSSTGLIAPFGLAFDSVGNLYVANVTNIEKLTSGGVGSVFATSGLDNPEGLAFDSAGNLYATNAGSSNTIEKFTIGGVGSVFASTGLSNPRGLAFDSAGSLYVANVDGSTIEKFTPGGVGSVFATESPGSAPFGLAFDSAGNLYVANVSINTIEKFTITAGVLSNVGSVFASSGLNGPAGLAFDSAGNLYAANVGNNTIEKFTPGGVGSVFATGVGLSGPEYLAFTNDAGVPLKLPPSPEPSACALLALSLPALLAFRRRRSAQA